MPLIGLGLMLYLLKVTKLLQNKFKEDFMFRKNRVLVLSIITLLLLGTVGQAAGFDYRGHNPKSYNVNYSFIDQYTNVSYNYNWVVTNFTSRPSQAPKPSLPMVPERPEKPENTDRPERPNRPENPGKPVLPEEVGKPELPNTSTLSQVEAEVVRLVNIERQKQGLAPFKVSSELSNVARVKSQDMAQNNYFSHTSPKYGSPFDMMRSFGIKYTTAGENIAKGYLTAQSVVNGWMNSSGHRANILNPSFNTIGVGAATDARGHIYWTQMFTN